MSEAEENDAFEVKWRSDTDMMDEDDSEVEEETTITNNVMDDDNQEIDHS